MHASPQPLARPTGALATLLALAVLLPGCAQITPDPKHRAEANEQVSGIDRHSAFPSITRTHFEQVNLVQMVDPNGRAALDFPVAWKDAKDADSLGQRYDLALAWFRQDKASSDTEKRAHRNSVQDKMLAVSTSRCNVFKTFLRRQQSDVNFLLGSATTAAGVLGAILPGVNASRNLAGVAGLFSGVQAEYNNSYYSNLGAHVIVQGIEQRQARLQKELIQARQSRDIGDYSMEAAIADAIYLDGTCSTVVGLLEAADSIKEVNNPGLGRAAEVIASVRAIGEIAAAPKVSELAETGALAKLLKQSNTINSPLVVTAAKPDSLALTPLSVQLANASRAPRQVDELLEQTAARMAQAFVAAQTQLNKGEQAKDLSGPQLKARFLAVVGAVVRDEKVLPLAACVAALAGPAGRLGEAEVLDKLEPTSADATSLRKQKLAGARADAAAAVDRVQTLVKAARDTAEDAAAHWAPQFGTVGLKVETLNQLDFAKPAPALAKSCPPPAA